MQLRLSRRGVSAVRRDVIFGVLALQHTPRQGSGGRSRLVTAVVTLVGGLGVGLGASQVAGWDRAPVVAFLLAAPAAAVSGLLPSLRLTDRVIIGVAAAIAINTVVALSMLSSHAWSLSAGIVVVGVISALIRLVCHVQSLDSELDSTAQVTASEQLSAKGVNT